MKKIRLLLLLTLLFTGVARGQNLISIHSVSSITQMNAISNPERGALIHVSDSNSNYQYTGSNWKPIAESEILTVTLPNLINSINTFSNAYENCPCLPFYEVGDTLGCGIVVYATDDGQHGLIMAFDEWVSSYNCNGVSVATSGASRVDGLKNCNEIVSSSLSNCTSSPLSAPQQALNYANGSGYCDGDWYLPSRNELRYVIENVDFINWRLTVLGEPLLETNPINTANIYNNSNTSYLTSTETHYQLGTQTLHLVEAYNISSGLTTWNKQVVAAGKIRPFKRF